MRVTDAMLRNLSPHDWLMFSRTCDAQGFSPLKEINRQNVARLQTAWSREMNEGSLESIRHRANADATSQPSLGTI